MLATLRLDILKKSKDTLGIFYSSLLVIASLVLLEFLNFHPAFLLAGLFLFAWKKNDRDHHHEQKVAREVSK
jgi:chromate transporter